MTKANINNVSYHKQTYYYNVYTQWASNSWMSDFVNTAEMKTELILTFHYLVVYTVNVVEHYYVMRKDQ